MEEDPGALFKNIKMPSMHRAIAQGLLGKMPGSTEQHLMEALIKIITQPSVKYNGYEDDFGEFSMTCRLPSLQFLQLYLNEVGRAYGVGVAIYTEPGGPYPVLCSLSQRPGEGGMPYMRIEFCTSRRKFYFLQPSGIIGNSDNSAPSASPPASYRNLTATDNFEVEKQPIQATSREESPPATDLIIGDHPFLIPDLTSDVLLGINTGSLDQSLGLWSSSDF